MLLPVTLLKEHLYLPGMFRGVVSCGNAQFPGYNHLLTTGTSGYNMEIGHFERWLPGC